MTRLNSAFVTRPSPFLSYPRKAAFTFNVLHQEIVKVFLSSMITFRNSSFCTRDIFGRWYWWCCLTTKWFWLKVFVALKIQIQNRLASKIAAIFPQKCQRKLHHHNSPQLPWTHVNIMIIITIEPLHPTSTQNLWDWFLRNFGHGDKWPDSQTIS